VIETALSADGRDYLGPHSERELVNRTECGVTELTAKV
jgi:hypothetical protein